MAQHIPKVQLKVYQKLLQLAQRFYEILPSYFYLVGGTAIMFKHRHRLSTDLDFFAPKYFSFQYWIKKVSKSFKIQSYSTGSDNIDFIIADTKISLVRFYYKNLKRRERIENIFVASDYDLFLNKIYAAGRRIEWRDPFDAAFLLQHHQWNPIQIKKDFEKKFPEASYEIFVGALLHKEDYSLTLPNWVWSTLNKLLTHLKE